MLGVQTYDNPLHSDYKGSIGPARALYTAGKHLQIKLHPQAFAFINITKKFINAQKFLAIMIFGIS